MLQPLLGSDGPHTRFTAAAAHDTQEGGGDGPAAVRTEPGSADGNSGPDWATFGETIGDYLIDSEELRTALRATDDRAQLQDIGNLLFDDDLAEWWPFAGGDAGVIAEAGATQGGTAQDVDSVGTLSHWGGDAGPGLGGLDNGWLVPGSAGDPRLGQPPEEDDGPFDGLPGSAGDPRLGQAPDNDDDPFTGVPGSAGDPRLGTSVDGPNGLVGSNSHLAAMQDSWEFAFDREDGLFEPAPKMPDAPLRQGGETGFDMGSLPIRDDGFGAAEPFWIPTGGDWDLLV